MFKPDALYCEKNIENYELGKELLEKYKDVPKIIIDNHNNIKYKTERVIPYENGNRTSYTSF